MKHCAQNSNTKAERVNNNTISEEKQMKTIAIAIKTSTDIYAKVLHNCAAENIEQYMYNHNTHHKAAILLCFAKSFLKAETVTEFKCKYKYEYTKKVAKLTGDNNVKCYFFDDKKARWQVSKPRYSMFYDRTSLSGERYNYSYLLDTEIDEVYISKYTTLKQLKIFQAELMRYHYSEYAYGTLLSDFVDKLIFNMQHDNRNMLGYQYRLTWDKHDVAWHNIESLDLAKALVITDENNNKHVYVSSNMSHNFSYLNYAIEDSCDVVSGKCHLESEYYDPKCYNSKVYVLDKSLFHYEWCRPCSYKCTKDDAKWLKEYLERNDTAVQCINRRK